MTNYTRLLKYRLSELENVEVLDTVAHNNVN